jgi:ABC-type transporter Mla MlaB component
MPAPDRTTITFAIRGPIARGDLPGLAERACRLLERSAPATVLCDVSEVPADAVTVDAVARLKLAARRYGCELQIHQPSAELRELVAFMGLSDVL